MFTVFGVNPEVEMPKIRAQAPDASDEALRAGLRLCKPKAVQEYDNRDVAERYAGMLRKAGWVEVSVRVQILTPPAKDGGLPGKKWISVYDLDDVDIASQVRLQSWKDGSRFAPRPTESALL